MSHIPRTMTHRKVRRRGWLCVVGTLIANGVLVGSLAWVNEAYQGRAHRSVSKSVEVYTPPAKFKRTPPPPKREIEEPEPEPEVLQPMQTVEMKMPIAPRIQVSPDLPDLAGVAMEVSAIQSQPVEFGTMDMADVDEAPRRTKGRLPGFPSWARRRNLEAVVTVEFTVQTDGSVCDVQIRELDGDDRFRSTVISAVQRWRFDPGKYRGQCVPVRCHQTINFKFRS